MKIEIYGETRDYLKTITKKLQSELIKGFGNGIEVHMINEEFFVIQYKHRIFQPIKIPMYSYTVSANPHYMYKAEESISEVIIQATLNGLKNESIYKKIISELINLSYTYN